MEKLAKYRKLHTGKARWDVVQPVWSFKCIIYEGTNLTNERAQKRDTQKIEATRVVIVHIFDKCDIDSDIYSRSCLVQYV